MIYNNIKVVINKKNCESSAILQGWGMKFITKIKIGLLTSAYWLMVNANIVFAQAGFVSCKGGLIKTADGYKLGCNLCDLLILVKNVITFMIELSVAFAGLFFAWGAFNMMIAGVHKKNSLKARKLWLSRLPEQWLP